MKKAISLVEVLISVALLSIVITAVFQMQQNNLFYLEKFKNTSLYSSYISLIVEQSDSSKLKNTTIYLSDKVNFDDDDIRKELKEIKIKIKDEEDIDVKLPKNDYLQTAKIIKSTYSISDSKASKTFYKFQLQ